jgi:hypothetical protein
MSGDFAWFHAKSKKRKLPKIATKEVATFFQTKIQVIQKIWRITRENLAVGLEVDVSIQNAGCGHKQVEFHLSHIATISLNKRSTLRSLAKSQDDSIRHCIENSS